MAVGAKLASAYVEVTADQKRLDADFASIKSKLAAFIKSAPGKIGICIASAAGVASIAGIGAKLLDAARKASSLGESLSKVQTTFGPAAKGVIDNADEMAAKFGVVKRETLDASAAFGLMAQSAGLSKAASAQVGREFVQLGIDLASFHNLADSDAFEKLRSGLAGESEPLRPLGILLSEDAVKAEALAIGLTKTNRQLNDQEKVMARLSLIRRQAGPAVGDKERTQDSAENAMKKLAGDVENATTAFGEKLIPALQSSIALARELGDSIAKTFGVGPVDAFAGALKTAADTMRVMNANTDRFRMVIDPKTGKAVRRTQETDKPSWANLGGLLITPAAKSLQDVANKLVGGQAAAGNGWGDQAARRQALLAANAEGKIEAQARADAKLEAKQEFHAGKIGGLGGGIAEAAGGGLGGLGALLAGDIGGALKGAAEDAQRDQEAKKNRYNVEVERKQIAEANKPRFDSQQFSSGGDFASFAIQKSLSDPDDTGKKQLAELEKNSVTLDELKEIGAQFIQLIANAPAPGAILRGRS